MAPQSYHNPTTIQKKVPRGGTQRLQGDLLVLVCFFVTSSHIAKMVATLQSLHEELEALRDRG